MIKGIKKQRGTFYKMASIWDTPFIVVDVETTGSSSIDNRITDISCVTVQGGEIIDEYSSLINPNQFIPPFIAKMTGISNELAASAPAPEKIFPEISSILSDNSAVFVAHNASFDWSFVRDSLSRHDLHFADMPRLCTLKLARRLMPVGIKKNLGNLAKHFGINITERHRAYGDAYATAELLLELLERAEQEHDIRTISQLLKFQNKSSRKIKPVIRNIRIIENQLKKIPNDPGIYYFYDKKGSLLYVGKAKSLKKRVRSYFNYSSQSSPKTAELIKKVYKINWECTGSELSALLAESNKIKKLSPGFNSLGKRYGNYSFIKLTLSDEFPRITSSEYIDNDGAEYFGPFRNKFIVGEIVRLLEKKFKLRNCTDPIHPGLENTPCFYHHIDQCNAPCSGLIDKDIYYKEVMNIRGFLNGFSSGLTGMLEKRMMEFSDNLEFEKAAAIKRQISEIKRVLKRNENVPTSVNKNNIIIILPASSKNRSTELLMIKTGRLVRKEIISARAGFKNINTLINKIYFNGFTLPLFYTQEDVDHLRIITSWIFRQRNGSHFIYPDGHKKPEVISMVESAIREVRTI